jgi:TetR/AcrR family transcriptional repressor of bet genes
MAKGDIQTRRKRALIAATIDEIGQTGSLEVTVGQIARKAGVSSALAHHYFGSKDHLFLAAMRSILTTYGDDVRRLRATRTTARGRIDAVVEASFSEDNFRPEVVAAWLNFYVLAQTSGPAYRLLRVYQRRLHSNLMADLRKLSDAGASKIAHTTAALIDGLFIRQALKNEALDAERCVALVLGYIDEALAPMPRLNAETGA